MSIVKRMTSQFYAQAAVWFHGTDRVDQAIADGAVGRIEGNTVTFRWPDGREVYHHVPVGGRLRAARCVNKFNERSRAAR